MMAKDKSIQTKIMIVILPVIVLISAYFLLFYEKGEEQTVNQKQGIMLLEPEAEETKLGSKSAIYDQEKTDQLNQEALIKSSNLDDLFAKVEEKKESEALAEVPENWIVEKNQSNTIEYSTNKTESAVSKPKKTSGSTSKNQYARKAEEFKEYILSDEETIDEEVTSIAKNTTKEEPIVSKKPGRQFYTNNNNTNNNTGPGNFINNLACVVASDHNIRSGQIVRMRTTQDIEISGKKIPKNTTFSGVASFQNERVVVKISNFKVSQDIIPVKLTVYDYDGVQGIYIPSGVNQEIAKSGVGQGISVSAKVPLIGSISTSTGQKKLEDPTVSIPAGYKVYLMSTDQ